MPRIQPGRTVLEHAAHGEERSEDENSISGVGCGHRCIEGCAGADEASRGDLARACRAVLAQLVGTLGETCNLTAPDGDRVVYMERVETEEPLRLFFAVGSHVPMHCTASGKLFLAHLPAARRAAILDGLPLPRYTATTLTDRRALEAELERIARQGYATDAEEFVDGLVCVAVPVPGAGRRTVHCAVALQAPAARMSLARALQQVPRLSEAAQALARTWT